MFHVEHKEKQMKFYGTKDGKQVEIKDLTKTLKELQDEGYTTIYGHKEPLDYVRDALKPIKSIVPLFLLILIPFLTACGAMTSTIDGFAPDREPMDNNHPTIQAAKIVAEEILGAPIDLDSIQIWSATDEEMLICTQRHELYDQIGGCAYRDQIMINNGRDAQSFCYIVAHELIHAGAWQNNKTTDSDHNHYDWDAIPDFTHCNEVGFDLIDVKI